MFETKIVSLNLILYFMVMLYYLIKILLVFKMDVCLFYNWFLGC
jgi:hypothetical protein